MTEKDTEDMLDTIFPIGEERWVKVKYLDRTKAIKTFHPNSKEKDRGYEIIALGVRDEHLPQLSAIVDLKDELVALLHGRIEPRMFENAMLLCNARIQELKARTIVDANNL